MTEDLNGRVFLLCFYILNFIILRETKIFFDILADFLLLDDYVCLRVMGGGLMERVCVRP